MKNMGFVQMRNRFVWCKRETGFVDANEKQSALFGVAYNRVNEQKGCLM